MTVEGESFIGADMYAVDLVDEHYLGCRFNDADLTEMTSRGVVFEECDFSGARLNASKHSASGFLRCSFRRTSLFDATFDECKLSGSTFQETALRPLRVTGGDWSFVSLRRADLAGITFSDTRLVEADFTGANLTGAALRDCDLSNAKLTHAKLAKADLRGSTLAGLDLATITLDGTRLDVEQAVVIATSLGAVVS